ncbi:enterochelin esterase domain-containing protein [Actinoplanes sp. URMC 104]|uniref:enterochelin esterase domain-containing protein n=1 Tax=Actinoplanes sp. URMC 104 TaxID=3423409 RepID=UPI003F1E31DF
MVERQASRRRSRGQEPRWRGRVDDRGALPGTDLWHGSEVLPADLLTIYCLLHGDAETLPSGPALTGEAHLDPLNPRRTCFPGDPEEPDDRDYWASILRLPQAPAERWTDVRPGVASGRLDVARVPFE